MKKRFKIRKHVVLFLMFLLPGLIHTSIAQNLLHNFEFNGNLNDTKPTGVSLTTNNVATSGFVVNPNGWEWTQPNSPGGGLTLSTNLLPDPTRYSLGFRIEFDATGISGSTGYKKILTFLGLSNDNGLYFHNGNLVLFPFTENSSRQYQPNTFYDFVLIRESNNNLKVYVTEPDGTVNLVYDVNDNTASTVPHINNGAREFNFFMNDTKQVGEYTTGGTVRNIRLWDTALTPSQITGALSSVTTNPATNITLTTATLHGEVNPQGNTASFFFEYGTTTAYGQTIAATPPSDNGSAAIAVSANLIGLAEATTYHYRLGSTVSTTNVNGSDRTFTTAKNTGPGVLGANLWLKANDGVTQSSANLTGWTDQTAYNTFTVTGTPLVTANAINFNPAISFSNTNGPTVLPTAYLSGNSPISMVTVYAVMRSNTNTSTLLGSTVVGADIGIGVLGYRGDPDLETGNGHNDHILSLNNDAITSYILAGKDFGTKSFSLNGGKGTLAQPGSGSFSSVSLTPMIGGTNNNGGATWSPFNGDVAEMIVYPTTLSLLDKQKAESYLAIKYGITLDASAIKYVNSAGNTIWDFTTHWHDVFGIGKDDGSGLNQIQSNSMNTGSGNGTGQSGKGNIVIQTPSALGNNDFLLIGHDARGLGDQSSDIPPSLVNPGVKRVEREWKVKHTADVGTVTLTMDFNGLGFSQSPGTTADAFKLLINTDGTGNFATGPVTTVDAASFVSNVATFNLVTLPDNAVFTFLFPVDNSTATFQNHALEFDGTDDYVAIPSSSALEITGNNGSTIPNSENNTFQGMSIGFWIYPTELKNGVILDKTRDSNHSGYAVSYTSDGKLGFKFGNGTAFIEVLSSANALQLNKWQHVDCFYDRFIGALIIYVNGELVVEQQFTPQAIATSDQELRLGSGHTTPGLFKGQLDEVLIWNINKEEERTRGFKKYFFYDFLETTTDLAAYYKFNNASGNTLTAKIGSTGTLNNFTGTPWIEQGPFNSWERSAWYKVDAGLIQNSDVSAWKNQGSLIETADLHAPTDNNNKPYYTTDPTDAGFGGFNFHPSISFDGNDRLVSPYEGTNFRRTPNLVGNDGESAVATQFYVYRRSSEQITNPMIIYGDNFDNLWALGASTDGDIHHRGLKHFPDPAVEPSGTFGTPGEIAMLDMVGAANSSSKTLSYSRDGNPSTSGIAGTFSNEVELYNLVVGFTANRNPKFSLAEVIIYSSQLDILSRRKVQSYLSLKYGTTNISDYAANSTGISNPFYYNSKGDEIWSDQKYWHDIFGIGHDNGWGLVQSKSHSSNTSDYKNEGIPGKGNLVLSNASSLEDGDFMIIGHDNSQLTQQSSDLPSNLVGKKRLVREWKVSHINGVGTVDLSFNLLGLNFQGYTKLDYKLLVDSDGDGDFTTGSVTEFNANSFANDIVDFIGVTLPNGAVFTFVTLQEPMGPGVLGHNLWLKANDGVSHSGGNVNGWADQAGINTFTKVGSIDFVTNAINFNPSTTFNNTDLNTAQPSNRLDGNTNITSETTYAVYKKKNGTFGGTVLGGVAAGNDYGVSIFGGEALNDAWVGNGNSGAYSKFENPSLSSNYGLVSFDVSPSSPSHAYSFYNGYQQTSTQGSGDFPDISFTPRIGGTNNKGSSSGWKHFQGELAEIVSYPTSIQGIDNLKVLSYLAIKYGLSLGNNTSDLNYYASDGTVIWPGSTNSAYKYDIFGIGKDEGSGLNQPQSNSMNTGSGDGTGQSSKGNIVLSDPSILDNNDFLIMGHDNTALTEQTTDLPASLAGRKRLVREWKVSHTNDVGTVDLKFSTLGLTLSGTKVADFKLLIDTDGNGDFTNGTVTEVAASSFSNNVVNFTGVTLPHDAIFTFVTGSKTITTWTGTWSAGVPTAITDAIIDADFTLTDPELITSNLTINSGKIVTINPTKSLNVKGNLINNGSIVFKSDASGSGVLDVYTGMSITGTGNETVERFIPARRAFRFLSIGVTTTDIYSNWQESGATAAGFGTHITGGASGGFDVTTTNNPSLYTHNNAGTGSWTAVPNTNATPLTAGTAYRLMVRGDRTISLASNTPTPTNTVLRATGTLKTGDFNPIINQTQDGFSFIGNPYQAPLDIKAVLFDSSNMDKNVVYYWDPNLNTRGAYVTRDLVTNSNTPSSSVTQYVQPGQAVFVKRDNTSNSTLMQINETHKSVSNAAAGVFKTKENNKTAIASSNLVLELNSPAVNEVLDATTIIFDDSFSWDALSGEDHTKFANLDEQVSWNHQTKNLAIAKQSVPQEQDELQLAVSNYRQTDYQWKFSLQNYSGPTPLLYDAMNQTYTEIVDGKTKSFSVNPQLASTSAANRFKIVFTNKTLGTTKFEQAEIQLYPNPAKAGEVQDFLLSNIQSTSTVKIYTSLGQEIALKTNLEGSQLRVTPATKLSAGLYLVQVNQDGNSSTIKWIVK